MIQSGQQLSSIKQSSELIKSKTFLNQTIKNISDSLKKKPLLNQSTQKHD